MRSKFYLQQSGVHIYELLISIVLIGVLIGIAVPSLAEYKNFRILKSESTRLALLAEDLVLQAVQREAEFRLVGRDGAYSVQDKEGNIQLTRMLNPAVNLDVRSTSSSTVIFRASGTVSPSRMNLTSGASSCTISISLRGRVTEQCT